MIETIAALFVLQVERPIRMFFECTYFSTNKK